MAREGLAKNWGIYIQRLRGFLIFCVLRYGGYSKYIHANFMFCVFLLFQDVL